jgi:hypothetical protein
MIPKNGTAQIVDKAQTVWTVKSGVVYEQPAGTASAAAAGASANVVLLYYNNGVVYQENSACQWWSWSGSTWVLSSNPAPTVTPACSASSSSSSSGSSSSSSSSSSGASSSFGIKVVGNTFTDLSGNVLQLQGENVTALEINDTSMWNAYYGTNLTTWQTIASTWSMNIIRLPLNEWAWRTNATSSGGTPYQTIVATAVANITAAHMYVILDLHWATPNGYNNGVADGQPGYLDADNSVNFWTSVATAYKNNPAVMFELFNEPYADDSGSWDSTRLNLLKSGGTFTFYNQASGKGNPVDTGVSFQVAGHQQLVTAIRNTGATNVILYSCPVWNSEPSESLAVMPTDPLNQLGATVHYANGSNADYTNILNAGIPIVMTEFYTLAGRGGYAWAQSNHIGYVMWGANNWNSSADLSSLINNAPWSYNSASVAWPL